MKFHNGGEYTRILLDIGTKGHPHYLSAVVATAAPAGYIDKGDYTIANGKTYEVYEHAENGKIVRIAVEQEKEETK